MMDVASLAIWMTNLCAPPRSVEFMPISNTDPWIASGQQTEKEFAPMKIMLAFAVLMIAFGLWSVTTLPMSNVVIWLLAIAGFFGMLALGLMCVEYIEWRAAHNGLAHRPSSYRWHVSL
jgi:amino acid permease